MKELYLTLSLTLSGLLGYLFIDYNGSIFHNIVFVILIILLLSSILNYKECKEMLNIARKERMYE
jgi:hypothetical protein